MEGEVTVGGLRCSEVLELLGDVIDGSVEAPVAARVQAHLAACDRCARFGGAVAAMLVRVHARLGSDAPEADEVAARLDARLAREAETDTAGPGPGGRSPGS